MARAHARVAAIALRSALATIALATAPENLTAQKTVPAYFYPFWLENGEVRFVRAISETTIVVLDVRFGPHRSFLSQSVSYSLYGIKCPGPVDKTSIAIIGSAPSEVALRPTVAPRYRTPGFQVEEREGALLIRGCFETQQFKGEPSPSKDPGTRDSYVPLWTDDREVHFLRRTSDSTVIVLHVLFAPRTWENEPRVSFQHFALKCQVPAKIAVAEIGSGVNERQALKTNLVGSHWSAGQPSPLLAHSWDEALGAEACREVRSR